MNKPVLQIENVSMHFGGLRAIDDVSFVVKTGEIFGIIGPNGSGKTTMFNVITGTYKPIRGTVRFNETVISGLPVYQIARMGIVKTKQIPCPFYNLNVLENIKIAACKDKSQEFDEILKMTNLYDKRDYPPGALTYHDRKKLELARALATNPEVILLDEIFAGLNPTEIKEIMSIVDDIHDRGLTIMIIEHIMPVVMNVAERIMVLNYGRKIAEGKPEVISQDEKVLDAYLGRKRQVQEYA